eukprot:3085348-Rhodomonas_salina.2
MSKLGIFFFGRSRELPRANFYGRAYRCQPLIRVPNGQREAPAHPGLCCLSLRHCQTLAGCRA